MKLILRIFVIISLTLGGVLSSFAMENSDQKITQVIQDFVSAKNPEWGNLKITVDLKNRDKIGEMLKDIPENASLKIVQVFDDFKPIGNVILPIQISNASGEALIKIFARAKIEIFKEVVCSANQINRGQRIEAPDLKLEERDVALLPNQYYSDLAQVISSEAKTIIPKNSTLFGWMIKEIPMIRRGAQVRLIVKADNLLVKAQGVALEDGYLNKEIKVKRSESNKILIGLVSSPDEVEVNLQ